MPRAPASPAFNFVITDKYDPSDSVWTYIWCPQHHFDNIKKGDLKACGCPPGPQVLALTSEAEDTLAGGQRGGSKSATGMAFFLKGNPAEPIHPTPQNRAQLAIANADHDGAMEKLGYCPWCVNASYIHHPGYVGLALRQSEKDMAYWLTDARKLYGKVGAVVTEKPARITFPSGAVIYVGHMDGEKDSQKYQGPSYTRVLWEELTQIPNENWYRDIFASTRTKYGCYKNCGRGKCLCGALHPQTFSTCNPGGPGHIWVKKMFVTPSPPNTQFKGLDGKSRIFIPMRLEDNPYLMRDEGYKRELETLKLTNPLKYRQWRLGDWDAAAGAFFSHFRPDGPVPGMLPEEPLEANHVISEKDAVISPWWPRFAGYDWGFRHESAILGFVEDPKSGRIYADRELVMKETGTVESGVQLALMFLDDLRKQEKAGGRPEMNVWLSPDAFGQRDATLTHAELIQKGIEKVLGEGACILVWPDGRVGAHHDSLAGSDFSLQTNIRVTLRHAQNARIAGAQYIRELLRWKRMEALRPEQFDASYYAELVNDDVERARRYKEAFARTEPETLPRLILLKERCPILIKSIPELQYAPEDRVTKAAVEDVMKTDETSDHVYDAMRYGLHSENVSGEREPQRAYIARRLAEQESPAMSFNDRIWLARAAQEKYEQEGNVDTAMFRPPSSRYWRQ